METEVISVKSLTKMYGSFRAVDGLSFHVNKGEIFGFLGPNGAGKTTTIKMLCGLLKPSSGEICFTADSGGKERASLLGYCPQENIHWKKLSCSEQLKFTAAIHHFTGRKATERIDFLLESMALTGKRNWRAGKLSGGLQRRLNICMALVHDPEIIIFDEPEAGLDPQSKAYVREFIKTLAGTKTVILTTHNMDEAERLATRIAIIDHGKLLKEGTNEKLIKELGEVDILEIRISEGAQVRDELLHELRRNFGEVDLEKNTLMIKGLEISRKLPAITALLEKQELPYEDLRIRKNTLEDVFLNLTGRSLRP